jgi:hypothetical protein
VNPGIVIVPIVKSPVPSIDVALEIAPPAFNPTPVIKPVDVIQDYDSYLKQLGFSGITRRVACSLISRTTEITKQSDNGRKLFLKGINPKGGELQQWSGKAGFLRFGS